MKTDNAQITGIIERCFDYSMDGRIPPANQNEFLTVGKRLRGSLVNLLSASFEDGTSAVVQANDAIAKRNQELSDNAQVLAGAATVLGNLNQLIGILDGLLKLASGFK